MQTKTLRKPLCLLAGMALATALLSGCATTLSDDESELPWNTPQSWEGSPSIPGLGDR